MTESLQKQPVLPPADDRMATRDGDSNAPPDSRRAPEYAAYALAFLSGCLATLAIRYMLRGASIQLSPESFVSLVFTIAVGAAALVLAIVAINYGRISERVMTERADRSIDIQMNLFQKSLDLQTQLFDKTMSTLESIGRSTGVTEQRLGDIHSLMQSPTFLKQIAGRAVEQTTSELSTSGKVGGQEGEFEAHLAERLTKNIVEELSSRWESLTRSSPGGWNVPPSVVAGPLTPSVAGTPERPPKSFEELLRVNQRKREFERARKHMQWLLEKAIQSIPEARLEPNKGPLSGLWEDTITYKGKQLAVDLRIKPPLDAEQYDLSIQQLFSHDEVDCLIFSFGQPPSETVKEHLENRNRALGGRVRFVLATDERQLQNDVLAVLESVAAELPSAG
jgi:hypothetical protein